MAVEKGKVITALTAKLAGKNVSKKLVERYATRYAEKIATDDDIDAYVDDRYEDVIDAQSEGDRRANKSAFDKEAEITERLKGKKTDNPNEPATPPDNEPETEIGKLTKLVTSLTQTVQGMQQERQTQSITERFTSHPDLKDVDPRFLKGRIPTDEASFDTAVQEAKTDWTDITSGFPARPAFGGDNPAPVGQQQQGSNGKVKEANKEQLDALASQMNLS